MNKHKIKIDVISDVVCPWCYIGKRRLEKAIASLPAHLEVEVAFQPFELNPDMPATGANQRQYLSAKFGSEDRYHQITAHVTRVAAEEGLHFDFARQAVAPNTFDAHRLIWLAEREGVQAAVKEALMSAYFEQGVDLSKKENLLAVVTAAGLDGAKAAQLLASDEGTQAVRQLEQLNYQRKISGVPFYIINNKYGVSGAQPAEVFVQALTQVGQEMATQGEACDIDERC
jgi:predicted DsbA family dithiol-disulfide isomerase